MWRRRLHKLVDTTIKQAVDSGPLDTTAWENLLSLPAGLFPKPGTYDHSAQDALVDEWDNLSPKCQKALQTSMTGDNNDWTNASRTAALNRAYSAKATLEGATAGTNIDWTLLAAIGIRETGFRNVNQGDGNGRGPLQIDVGKNPGAAGQASDLASSATWAAQFLAGNMAYLAQAFPNFDATHLLQATAASYNLGKGGFSGNPNTIDAGTTGNNYGSNVVNLLDCFK